MPPVQPEPRPEADSHTPHPKSRIHTVEATGLLVIALLILILTLIRYWHEIPWGAR